jgi:hypothetical protein
MPEPNERAIIRRAFELWLRAGCPERKDKDLCRQAVKELREEEIGNADFSFHCARRVICNR